MDDKMTDIEFETMMLAIQALIKTNQIEELEKLVDRVISNIEKSSDK